MEDEITNGVKPVEEAFELEPVELEGYDGPTWLYAIERLKRFLIAMMLMGGTFWCVSKYLGAVIAAGDLAMAQTVIVALLTLVGSVAVFYFGTHKSTGE